jgi:Ser/Thr protein kinase RdoA (MazF antagonist)
VAEGAAGGGDPCGLLPRQRLLPGGKFAAAFDFYFACTDALAYDIAVALNAWCFEPDGSFNITAARALVAGYEARRPLSAAERGALPVLAHGAAMRFFLTRLHDLARDAGRGAGEAEGPAGVRAQAGGAPFVARPGAVRRGRMTPHVMIFTDGACSGNPGPGGWARS